tara:strand:+ start:116 stop:415 length:300 start_codon:yes stop_codon:yes gene_type:complete
MSRYNNIPRTRDEDGKRLYRTVKYPDIPRRNNDTYVVTTEGDRYDILASQYYKDSSLWWVVSSANAEYAQGSIYPPVGIQLRIPGDLGLILEAFNDLNG